MCRIFLMQYSYGLDAGVDHDSRKANYSILDKKPKKQELRTYVWNMRYTWTVHIKGTIKQLVGMLTVTLTMTNDYCIMTTVLHIKSSPNAVCTSS